jgi:aspartyl protease family protein
MNGYWLAIGALILVGAPAIATGQALTKCTAGQEVTDTEGKTGVIVSDDSKLCQVKYPNGQIYSWIFWNLRPAAAVAKPGQPASGAGPPGPTDKRPSSNTPSSASVEAPTVLKPSADRILVYQADRRGHFTVSATVNGTPIRLVVDTGASLVALTLEDARAAGFDRSGLVFNRATQTANGSVRFAPVMLREIRIERLSIENVPAAVIENLDQSLLGMSFLSRLKNFEMREGALTISW